MATQQTKDENGNELKLRKRTLKEEKEWDLAAALAFMAIKQHERKQQEVLEEDNPNTAAWLRDIQCKFEKDHPEQAKWFHITWKPEVVRKVGIYDED